MKWNELECEVRLTDRARYCDIEPEYATEFKNLYNPSSVGHDGAMFARAECVADGGLQDLFPSHLGALGPTPTGQCRR